MIAVMVFMRSADSLYSAAVELFPPVSRRRVFHTIVTQAKSIVVAKHVSLFLPEGKTFKRVSTTFSGLSPIVPRKKGMTMAAYKKGVVQARSPHDSHDLFPWFAPLEVGWNFSIPVMHTGRPVGVLGVFMHPSDRFSRQHLDILQRYAALAALALENLFVREMYQQRVHDRNLRIAFAAHEIKNPMTAISLRVQLLNTRVLKNKKKAEEIASKLNQDVSNLKHVVNEFLTTKQIDLHHFPVHLTKHTVAEVAQLLKEYCERTIMSDRLSFSHDSLEAGGTVFLDKAKLHQVLTNLITNAVKFSPPKSTIHVTLIKKRKFLCIEVKDHGMGIDAKDRKKVFQPYYQGKNADKKGMGLGLYLVKLIVQRHFGKIHLTSEVQKGTTVTISLPLSRDIA